MVIIYEKTYVEQIIHIAVSDILGIGRTLLLLILKQIILEIVS